MYNIKLYFCFKSIFLIKICNKSHFFDTNKTAIIYEIRKTKGILTSTK